MRWTKPSTGRPKKQETKQQSEGSTKVLPAAGTCATIGNCSNDIDVVVPVASSSSLPTGTIRLKNGSPVPLSGAVSCYEVLDGSLRYHREEFEALRALALAFPQKHPEVEADLREAGLIKRDGTLLFPYQDVLASCDVVETATGFELTLPCHPEDEGQWREETERQKHVLVAKYRATTSGQGGGVAP